VINDSKYATGSKIYNPNLRTEKDTLRHYDYLNDFNLIQQFPLEVRKFFLVPIGKEIIQCKTTTLVFPAFVYKDENNFGKIELIKKVLLSILKTGRYDIYEGFLSNVGLQQIVETDDGFRFLWPPAHERLFLSIVEDPQILLLVQLIRSRIEIQLFSIGTLQDSLLKISRLMEWPEQDEMKKYAMERLQSGNEVCHPVFKDANNEGSKLCLFSNYIVYVAISENGSFIPSICISPVHSTDIISKHTHILIKDLPDRYYYLFSGELVREASSEFIIFNLNSGMFYYKQLESDRKNILSIFDLTSDEPGTLQSYFCSEVLNWTLLAQTILSSLLSEPVSFVSNIRPYNGFGARIQ
jgi:hypothetical protein